MARDEIPNVIREAFDQPALDEPAPPPPNEPEPEGDDHGWHHHMIEIAVPSVAVYADGSVHSQSWAGTLLVGWCWLASSVTVGLIVWTAVQWFPLTSVWALSLFAAGAGVSVGVLVLGDLIAWGWRWACRRWKALP